MKKVAETSKGLGYIFKFCNEFLAVLIQEDESRTFVTIDRKTAWVVTLLHEKAVVRKVSLIVKHATLCNHDDSTNQARVIPGDGFQY